MKKSILLITVLLATISLIGQTTFFTKFDNNLNYWPKDIYMLADGNILCSTFSWESPSSPGKSHLYLFNGFGDTLKSMTYPCTSNLQLELKCIIEKDNQIYVFGYGTKDLIPFVCMKAFDYNLNEITEYDFSLDESICTGGVFNGIRAKQLDSTFLLCGSVSSNILATPFYIEISFDGEEICSAYDTQATAPLFVYDFYKKPGTEQLYTFSTTFENSGPVRFLFTKYDTLMNVISENEVSDNFRQYFTSIPVSNVFNTTFYVAGNERDSAAFSEATHFGIYKISTEGVLLDKYLHYNLQDTSTQVALYNSLSILPDDNLVICTSFNVGFPYIIQQEPSYIMLYKFSPELDLLWQRYIGGEGMYEAYAMRTTPEGGILVTGCFSETPPNGSTKKEFFILQTDGNGLFTGMDDDQVKITSSEAIVFPNPARGFVNIEFSQVYQTARFQLLDIGGKMVLEKQLTTNRQSINISAIPAGTYVYRIFNEKGLDERGKVVVE